MSTETTKKPRKAPVKKEPTATVEKKTKAAPRSKAAKAAVAEVAVASNLKQWPAHEEIARLAHRYYEERGQSHGFDEEDWFRAEQELLAAS